MWNYYYHLQKSWLIIKALLPKGLFIINLHETKPIANLKQFYIQTFAILCQQCWWWTVHFSWLLKYSQYINGIVFVHSWFHFQIVVIKQMRSHYTSDFYFKCDILSRFPDFRKSEYFNLWERFEWILSELLFSFHVKELNCLVKDPPSPSSSVLK